MEEETSAKWANIFGVNDGYSLLKVVTSTVIINQRKTTSRVIIN